MAKRAKARDAKLRVLVSHRYLLPNSALEGGQTVQDSRTAEDEPMAVRLFMYLTPKRSHRELGFLKTSHRPK